MVEPDRNSGAKDGQPLNTSGGGESIQGKLEDVLLDSTDSRVRKISLDALYTIQIAQNKYFNAF
jgi:hypothetical protein